MNLEMFWHENGWQIAQLACIVGAFMGLSMAILMCGFWRKKTTRVDNGEGNGQVEPPIAMNSIVHRKSSLVMSSVTNSTANDHSPTGPSVVTLAVEENNYESVTSGATPAAAGPTSSHSKITASSSADPNAHSKNGDIVRHVTPCLPPRNITSAASANLSQSVNLGQSANFSQSADHAGVVAGPIGAVASLSNGTVTAKPDYATISIRAAAGGTLRQAPPTSFTSALDETYESIDNIEPAASATEPRLSLQPPVLPQSKVSLYSEIAAELPQNNILSSQSQLATAGTDDGTSSVGYARISNVQPNDGVSSQRPEDPAARENEAPDEDQDVGFGAVYAVVNKNRTEQNATGAPISSKDIVHIIAKVSKSNERSTPSDLKSELNTADNSRKSIATGEPQSSSDHATYSQCSGGYEKVDFEGSGKNGSIGQPLKFVAPAFQSGADVDYESVDDLMSSVTVQDDGQQQTGGPAVATGLNALDGREEIVRPGHIYEEMSEVSAEIERIRSN